MNGDRWHEKMLKRFEGRKDLSKDELYKLYFEREGLSRADVLECLRVIESELNITSGILRPEDNLDTLFEPISTSNPLKWLTYQARAGDRQAEISYQLNKRLLEYGTFDAWAQIETVNDLVRAWCGQTPEKFKQGIPDQS